MNQFTHDELRKIGCDVLTGERCAAHMRLLCDITKEFCEITETYIDTHDLWNHLAESYNYGDKRRSIMLSHSMLREIWVFATLQLGGYVVQSGEQYWSMAAEDYDKMCEENAWECAGFKNMRTYRPWKKRDGVTRASGTNVHQMRMALGEESPE